MKYLVNLDLSKNELQNARIQNLASAPSDPVAGQIYYNTAQNKAYVYNGTVWVPWEGEINQNAFSNVNADGTVISASTKTDSLKLSPGTNVAFTVNQSDKKITISATDTKYTPAASVTDVSTSSVVGTSTNYARQDHAHKIALATGDSNGQVKIAGSNVSVKGLAAAAYKGVDTTVSSTSENLPTSKAVASAISTAVGAADAMRFKGTIGTGGTVTALPNSHQRGDTYRVITAGTYAGQTCEIGDLIIALGTSGTSATDWTVAQTNIDGAITGVEVTGNGNAVTTIEKNGTKVKATKGATFLTAHRTYTSVTGKPTGNQTPGFGDTVTISQIQQSTTGQITATDRTITIPNAIATNTTPGLLSASNSKLLDKLYLQGIIVYGIEITAGKTSVDFDLPQGYYFTGYSAYIEGIEQVFLNVTGNEEETVTFSINSAQTHDIFITVYTSAAV